MKIREVKARSRTFSIELTEEELMAIVLVSTRIGGEPSGPRGTFDKFLSKGREALGMYTHSSIQRALEIRLDGHIRFVEVE